MDPYLDPDSTEYGSETLHRGFVYLATCNSPTTICHTNISMSYSTAGKKLVPVNVNCQIKEKLVPTANQSINADLFTRVCRGLGPLSVDPNVEGVQLVLQLI